MPMDRGKCQVMTIQEKTCLVSNKEKGVHQLPVTSHDTIGREPTHPKTFPAATLLTPFLYITQTTMSGRQGEYRSAHCVLLD